MTLMYTLATCFGIVQASDSNLTTLDDQPASTGPKLFRLGFVEAAISVSGAYSVGGESMELWMADAIAGYSAVAGPTMEGFAEQLRIWLQTNMTDDEKATGSLMHLAGYEPGSVLPEFHFIRNVKDIDPYTGNYVGRTAFKANEEFLAVYCETDDKRREFLAGERAQWFINGLADGRVVYHELSNFIDLFFAEVWRASAIRNWQFREPQSLEDLGSMTRAKFEVMAALFELSRYGGPPVGGPTQIELIPAPTI